jgi:hypothetical protein
MSQMLTGGAIDMLHRSIRSGVIAHVAWFVSIWLVDSARRMDGPRTPLAASDHCRRGSPSTIPPLRGNAESRGARYSPQSSKMAGSILGASAELSRWAQPR